MEQSVVLLLVLYSLVYFRWLSGTYTRGLGYFSKRVLCSSLLGQANYRVHGFAGFVETLLCFQLGVPGHSLERESFGHVTQLIHKFLLLEVILAILLFNFQLFAKSRSGCVGQGGWCLFLAFDIGFFEGSDVAKAKSSLDVGLAHILYFLLKSDELSLLLNIVLDLLAPRT